MGGAGLLLTEGGAAPTAVLGVEAGGTPGVQRVQEPRAGGGAGPGRRGRACGRAGPASAGSPPPPAPPPTAGRRGARLAELPSAPNRGPPTPRGACRAPTPRESPPSGSGGRVHRSELTP